MNQYRFHQIVQDMKKKYGKAEEDPEIEILFCMESNVLRAKRKHPEIKDFDMQEALCAALYTIKGYLTGKQEDVSKYVTEQVRLLQDAVLYAVDPFRHPEQPLCMALMDYQEDDRTQVLEENYRTAIRCMVRTAESVNIWRQAGGGYFALLERDFGAMVKEDAEDDYTIAMSERVYEITKRYCDAHGIAWEPEEASEE
ncbi:MAG: hypothetical protein IJ083_14845 [Clostridia bacterium]|nr:hypothetical protein [Clostridia bacterium]